MNIVIIIIINTRSIWQHNILVVFQKRNPGFQTDYYVHAMSLLANNIFVVLLLAVLLLNNECLLLLVLET